MQQPVIFIGSSTEAKDLARALSLSLRDEPIKVKNWATSQWRLSRSTLDDLEELLQHSDFAAFILSADDMAIIRGKESKIPRHNVLFELGLSFGKIGRERTFALVPHQEMHKPSDLDGLTVVTYRPADGVDAMSDPSSEILREIKQLGLRDRAATDGLVRRGSTATIGTVADGSVEVYESRHDYIDDLRHAVSEGEKVPAKFQFAAADGGRYWLRLCRSQNYHYFEHAKRQLKAHIPGLAEKVQEAAGTAAVDVISLGCGDGIKDNIVLSALAERLTRREQLYYYPVDISDILLVEAIRHISRQGPEQERYRCKAVLGDFTNLASIKELINYRPNPNLFLVLGNVIGSFDEAEILASVAAAMRPEDLVLIEANVGEPDQSLAMLRDDDANRWDLSTLAALGIPRDSFKFQQGQESGHSDVSGTRTLVSYAVSHKENGQISYTLSGMHHYDYDELQKHVQRELRVTLLDANSNDGVGLILGQRV